MAKFPSDIPVDRAIRTLERLGFRMVRIHSHISMTRPNPDGTNTPLTLPNHRRIKGFTMRTLLTQAGISRDAFEEAYKE